MVKTLTINDVMKSTPDLIQVWGEQSNELKVNSKALFNIIKVKKALEEQLENVQEAVQKIMEQHGAKDNGKGGLVIEDAQAAKAATMALNELSTQRVDITYSPIILKETDCIPPKFMDLLFDFIEFEE